MGGYFAPYVNEIRQTYGPRFLGVVEDTENGLQRYLSEGIECPIFSVARSPLKRPENVMVGAALVQGAEKVLRKRGRELSDMRCALFGFGKIGEEVAYLLARRRLSFVVYDHDPVRMLHARSLGYDIAPRGKCISEADLFSE